MVPFEELSDVLNLIYFLGAGNLRAVRVKENNALGHFHGL
jgi:hypothetical protein